MASRTRFLTSYFVNAFVSFNRRSHRYDSFNCLRIRKITGLKSPTVCGVFWRKTSLEDEVLLTQDKDEKRSSSPKHAIHGGFDLAPSGYHEYIRDTAKLWVYRGKTYILNLELEESPHYALPVKYMNYESIEYDRQYKEIMRMHRRQKDLLPDEFLSGFASSDRLIPVITIGVYLGERMWAGFTRLGEMTGLEEIPPEIRQRMLLVSNDFQVNLFDIHTLETSDIFQTDLREVFGFLKLKADKEKLKCYVEENETFQHLKEDAYDVLCL